MEFYSKLAREIQPYTAGEQPKGIEIKLNANENPYPPAPRVKAALESFQAEELKYYPPLDGMALRRAIAETEGVEPGQIFLGNGSDEVLAFSFAAFFDPDGAGACFPDITYSFYPVYARLFSIPVIEIALRQDFTIDLSALSAQNCQGYYLANPNAPTGIGIPREEMERFLQAVPDRLVIADEAYMDFYGQSLAPLVGRYSNLLVVKTFSKSYSLAGIRCGYAIGQAPLIDALCRIRDSFNSYPVDRVCQAVCLAALQDREYHEHTVALVCSERERVRDALLERGFCVPQSSTNFLFAGRAKMSAKHIYLALKERGVLVRYWDRPRICDFCRITIGTKEENDILLKTLDQILS